jgi:hypothetical protein
MYVSTADRGTLGREVEHKVAGRNQRWREVTCGIDPDGNRRRALSASSSFSHFA